MHNPGGRRRVVLSMGIIPFSRERRSADSADRESGEQKETVCRFCTNSLNDDGTCPVCSDTGEEQYRNG